MKKTTLTGVFTPKTKKDSVKFQKLAIALGFAWKKAGVKVISLNKDQAISLKEGGKMVPCSSCKDEDTLTIAALEKAVIDSREGRFVTTRASLLQVFNETKCREIEDVIKKLLQENFDKEDNEEFVVPQEYIDRAAVELTDEQRQYFADAGLYISHPYDGFKLTSVNGEANVSDVNLRTKTLTEVASSTKVGSVFTDTDGNVYFVNK